MLKKLYKTTKRLYSREYRKEHPEKIKEYNRKTVKQRAARNKARQEAEDMYGASAIKNKDIHHADSNPTNNSRSNLKIRKRHHEGGVKGNKNAAGKHR